MTQLYGASSVAQLYRSAFKSFGPRLALVNGDVRLSYAELEARCHQTVRYFEQLGLRRQDGIALLSGNKLEAVIVIIAVQLMGLRYTALHGLASEEDHLFALQDAGIKTVVVDAERYEKRGLAIEKSGIVSQVLTLGPAGFGENLVKASAGMDRSDITLHVKPDDIAKISYTGGTTGKSKGVLQMQRTAVTMTLQQLAIWEWPEEIRLLVATPISHASGTMLLPTFLRGGTIYLLEKYDERQFLALVQEHRITATFLVPTQIYGLLDFSELGSYDFSSLQFILYGAAPIAHARLVEAVRTFGPVLAQLYGQTEAPMTITYLRKDEHDLARPHLMTSCGRAVAGNDIKLLDAQLNEVPAGTVGELCVRGPLLMGGYWNRPEETIKAFAGDWLHTGDMARADAQGYLYLVDRAKDMIITGGYNVFSSEVESCLALHPAVSQSAVIGVPHERWGEAVTAIVVLKSGADVTADELIGFVLKHKGAVNTPKAIHFKTGLPMTALGKIDKKALRAGYWIGQDRQVG